MKGLVFKGGSSTLRFQAIASMAATVGEGGEGFLKLS